MTKAERAARAAEEAKRDAWYQEMRRQGKRPVSLDHWNKTRMVRMNLWCAVVAVSSPMVDIDLYKRLAALHNEVLAKEETLVPQDGWKQWDGAAAEASEATDDGKTIVFRPVGDTGCAT